MKKFATKKRGSFNEPEKASNEFSRRLTYSQRPDAAQILREQYYLIKGVKPRSIDKGCTKKVSLK